MLRRGGAPRCKHAMLTRKRLADTCFLIAVLSGGAVLERSGGRSSGAPSGGRLDEELDEGWRSEERARLGAIIQESRAQSRCGGPARL